MKKKNRFEVWGFNSETNKSEMITSGNYLDDAYAYACHYMCGNKYLGIEIRDNFRETDLPLDGVPIYFWKKDEIEDGF